MRSSLARALPALLGCTGVVLAAACGSDSALPSEARSALALDASRAAAKMVPFKGRATGFGGGPADPDVVCAAPAAPASFGVTGNGTHLGLFTSRGTACNTTVGVTFPTAHVSVAGGRATIEAANGDRLFTTYGGTADVNLNCTALNELSFEFVVVGGTGRFAGASGRFTVVGTQVPGACAADRDPPPGFIDSAFDGEVSSVGSLK